MRNTVEWWAGNGGRMAVSKRKKANARGTFRKVKKLNDAALKLVDDNAPKIAQSLLDSTLEGHVQSARLLVDLAEGNVEGEEAAMSRPFRSLALELAGAPEWKGEMTEAEAETDGGSREPEG